MSVTTQDEVIMSHAGKSISVCIYRPSAVNLDASLEMNSVFTCQSTGAVLSQEIVEIP